MSHPSCRDSTSSGGHQTRRSPPGVALRIGLPWLGLLVVAAHGASSREPGDPALSITAPSSLSPPAAIHCRPGPWGDLYYYYFALEPSAALLKTASLPDGQPHWHFVDLSRKKVEALFDTTDLSDDQRSSLKAGIEVTATPPGCHVRPRPELVASLSAPARRQIYSVLGQWEENPPQHNAMTIPVAMLDRWLDESGLSDATIRKIRSLLYTRGETVVFADFHLLAPLLRDRQEERHLLRLIFRERTLVLRLRISAAGDPAATDLEAVARYWTAGGKSKNVLPLLEAIARTPEVEYLDVIHLLPPLARMWLYSYPGASDLVDKKLPDCHWTSFNFFNVQPDHRFLDRQYMADTLRAYYVPIEAPYQYGDLLLFFNRDKPWLTIHSVVYLAADVVFTKNGQNPTAPWILMTIEDLKSRYSYAEPLVIQGYRRR